MTLTLGSASKGAWGVGGKSIIREGKDELALWGAEQERLSPVSRMTAYSACSWFEFTPPALCRQAKLQRDFLVPATRLKTSNKIFPCLHLSQAGLNEGANKASVPTLDEFCRV